VWSQLYFVGHGTVCNSLCIGITDDKIHALYALVEHMVHRIAPTTSNAYHLDDGRFFFGKIKMYHDSFSFMG
jgi:hypothetical protein